jgi:hypothetical protein
VLLGAGTAGYVPVEVKVRTWFTVTMRFQPADLGRKPVLVIS